LAAHCSTSKTKRLRQTRLVTSSNARRGAGF